MSNDSRSRFPVTRWSIVNAAAHDDPAAHAALAWLCERYWEPLRQHALRRGWRPASAEDLVQQLLMEIVMRRDLATVDAARGRFRTWLMACLDHLAHREREHRMAIKRGAGQSAQSFDEQVPGAEPDAARAFDRAWAVEVIARARDRLASEEHARGAGAVFDALRPYLEFNAEAETYANLGVRLGLGEGAVKVAIHRLRQRLGAALRSELAETLVDPTPEAVSAELAALQAALSAK